jgi:hypothetical protein
MFKTPTSEVTIILFLSGYLIILSLITSFIVAALSPANIIVTNTMLASTDITNVNSITVTNMINIFYGLINPFITVPDSVIPSYLQILFWKIEEIFLMAVLVILGVELI